MTNDFRHPEPPRSTPAVTNANLSINRSLLMAAGGAVGGVMGFALSEMVDLEGSVSEAEIRSTSGLWFMLVVLGVGVGVVAATALIERRQPSIEVILLTAAALLVGGFASGYLAQSVFSAMVVDSYDSVRIARVVGWGIAGVMGGLAITVASKSSKRIQNGAVGGLVGGLVGGALFDPIAEVFAGNDPAADASTSRFVAIMVIGTLIGLSIGFVNAARTYMWVEVLSGEFRGRTYPVMDDPTRIGSARNLEVWLGADRSIAEVHLSVSRAAGDSFTCTSGQQVVHNGVPATTGRISNGDVMKIGATDVRFSLKNAPSGPTTGPSAVGTEFHASGHSPSTAAPGTTGRRMPARLVDGSTPSVQAPSAPQHPTTPAPGTAGAPRPRPRLDIKRD